MPFAQTPTAKIRPMWNGLVLILLMLLAAYVLFGALIYFSQASLIYYPTREHVAHPRQLGLDYEPVSFRSEDGLALSGWYVPAASERAVVLFLHGNAGNISHRLPSLQIFNHLGLSTLIFDYRGYGKSEGRPDEAGTYRDAQAAWRYLVETRGLDPRRIVFFGRSLGAAVASHLATSRSPRALIIESAFTSVPDLGAKFYPFMPVQWLSRFNYSTRDHLARIDSPLLVIHSRHDEIVPFEHGRLLFEMARPPKQFLELQGGHNDAFLVSGRLYVEGLNRFLSGTAGL